MFKAIKRFFSHTERLQRKRNRQAKRDREELQNVYDHKMFLCEREETIVRRLQQFHIDDLLYRSGSRVRSKP